MSTRVRLLVAGLLMVVAAGCDQSTKYQAVARLTDGLASAPPSLVDRIGRFFSVEHPRRTAIVEVVEGFWDFGYVENDGVAFSMLRDAPGVVKVPLLLSFAAVAVAALGWLVVRRRDALTLVSAALIAGGAIGNAIDRGRSGYVVDFIHWHLGDAFHWPVFNVADIWVFVGAVLLMASGLRSRGGPSVAQAPA